MRFVIVHPLDPWGSKIGGIETAIRSLIQYAPEDFDVEIIGVSENKQERPLHQWQQIPYKKKTVCFYPILEISHPNQRTWLPLFLRFPMKLRQEKFGLHNAIVFYHRIESLSMARLPSKANALCVHGDPREIVSSRSEVRWRHVPRIYSYFESRAVHRSGSIFVVSRSGLEYMQRKYPSHASHFSYLPTWFQEEIFFPEPETLRQQNRAQLISRLNLPEAARFIFFAGRFEAQKNPLLALETFAHAAQSDSRIHLLAAGSGSLALKMQQFIQTQNLQQRFHDLGSLSPLDMAKIMRVSHVLLVTSEFEGLPMLVLEAQACGLPVVSTDTGEIRTVITQGRSGHICSQNNPEHLSKAVLEVIHHPERFIQHNCTQAAVPFHPQKILPPLFERLRTLDNATK